MKKHQFRTGWASLWRGPTCAFSIKFSDIFAKNDSLCFFRQILVHCLKPNSVAHNSPIAATQPPALVAHVLTPINTRWHHRRTCIRTLPQAPTFGSADSVNRRVSTRSIARRNMASFSAPLTCDSPAETTQTLSSVAGEGSTESRGVAMPTEQGELDRERNIQMFQGGVQVESRQFESKYTFMQRSCITRCVCVDPNIRLRASKLRAYFAEKRKISQ